MKAGDLEEVLAIAAAAGAPHWPRSVYEDILHAHPPGESGPALIRFGVICHHVFAELPEPGKLQNGEVQMGEAPNTTAPAGFGVISLLRPERLAEIEIIAVRPEFWRRGIGTALTQELLDAARRNGAQAIRLEVRPSNAAAIALYRRQGFSETGRRPGYYSAPAEDAVIFAKKL